MTDTVKAFPARHVRTKDGDTQVYTVDRSDNDTSTWTIRLRGIDAPDKGDLKLQATELARSLLLPGLSFDPVHDFWLTLTMRQMNDGSLERDKYGRMLGSVILNDGTVLAEHLLAAGLAKPWNGQGPHPWLLLPPPVHAIMDTRTHLDGSSTVATGYVPRLFRGPDDQ